MSLPEDWTLAELADSLGGCPGLLVHATMLVPVMRASVRERDAQDLELAITRLRAALEKDPNLSAHSPPASEVAFEISWAKRALANMAAEPTAQT